MALFSENSSTTTNRTTAQRDASYGGSRGFGSSSTPGYAGSTSAHTPSASGSLASAISHGINTQQSSGPPRGFMSSGQNQFDRMQVDNGALLNNSFNHRYGLGPSIVTANEMARTSLGELSRRQATPNNLAAIDQVQLNRMGLMANKGQYRGTPEGVLGGFDANAYDKQRLAGAGWKGDNLKYGVPNYRNASFDSPSLNLGVRALQRQLTGTGPQLPRGVQTATSYYNPRVVTPTWSIGINKTPFGPHNFLNPDTGRTPSVVADNQLRMGALPPSAPYSPQQSPKVAQAQPQAPSPNLVTRSPTGYMGDISSFNQPTPNLGTRAPTGYYGDINTYKPQSSDYRGAPPLPTRDNASANDPNFVSVSSVPPIPSPEPRLGTRAPTGYYGDIGSFNQPTPNLGTRADASYYGSTPTSRPQRDQANVQAQNYGFNAPPAYPRAPEPNLGTRSSPGYMGDVNSYKPSPPEALVSELKTATTPDKVAEVVSKTPALSQIESKAPGTVAALLAGLNSKNGSENHGLAKEILSLLTNPPNNSSNTPSSNPADVNLMIQRLLQNLGTPSTHKNIVSFA